MQVSRSYKAFFQTRPLILCTNNRMSWRGCLVGYAQLLRSDRAENDQPLALDPRLSTLDYV
jgi:hypothetical protein